MITLFKKKSFVLSIIIIVFIISVGTFGIINRKKTSKDNITTTKNTTGTKIISNTVPSSKSSVTSQTSSPQQSKSVEQPKSQPAPKEVVSSQKAASTSTVPPSKKTASPTKQTDSPAKTVPSSSPQKYISNNLGFSITFPASWKNKYTVKEDNNGLIVKFKPVSNPIAGGMLFEIIKKSSDFNEGMSDGIGKRYITAKGVTYIIGGPMDIGFPPDNPEFSSYRKLASQLSSVALTIKSIN